jgi:transposase
MLRRRRMASWLVFGEKDQMNVYGEDAVPTVQNLLLFDHSPRIFGAMERRQAFQFELRPQRRTNPPHAAVCRGVRAKSRLNRSILDASPFEFRRQLGYKTLWRGGCLMAVPPQNTGRKCPVCGHISKENRKTQELFVCARCGFSANAHFVAACNIREAGLALLACSQSSLEVRASCQEPTEAFSRL